MAGSAIPDISKASLPITVVAAMLMAGLSYWVNAQEREIEHVREEVVGVERKVDGLEDEIAQQKLDVKDRLNEIATEQALNAQLLKQIARKLEVIEE